MMETGVEYRLVVHRLEKQLEGGGILLPGLH